QAPLTLGMLGLLVAVALSHLFSPSHIFFIWGARMSAYKFFKVVVYYLLLVGLMDTPRRLQHFLTVLGLFVAGLTIVTLLQFHEIIALPNIDVSFRQLDRDEADNITGETPRLQSTGAFNDPNDFCLVLVTGMVLAAYGMGNRNLLSLALIWLPSL